MHDVETARTYWAALGQIAGVFAIPLVIEARRSVARWRATAVRARRLQALFYGLAAFAIYDAVSASLTMLIAPRFESVSMIARAVEVTAVAFGLVINPVLTYVWQANRDLLIILQRALPWSMFRRLRHAVSSTEATFVKLSRSVIRGLDEMDEFETDLLALRGKNTSGNETLNKVAEGFADLIEQVTDEQLPTGMTREELKRTFLDQVAAVGNDPDLKANITSQLRRVRAHRRKLWDEVIELDRRSRTFDEVRSYLDFWYLDPELREALESEIANVADDAADKLSSPTNLSSPDLLSPIRSSTNSIIRAWSELASEAPQNEDAPDSSGS